MAQEREQMNDDECRFFVCTFMCVYILECAHIWEVTARKQETQLLTYRLMSSST